MHEISGKLCKVYIFQYLNDNVLLTNYGTPIVYIKPKANKHGDFFQENKSSEGVEMAEKLEGKRIAILVANGFEEVEMTEPKKALEEARAETSVISPEGSKVRAWNKDDWSDEYDVDISLDSAKAEDYDGLLLPGGVMNPDRLRQNDKAIEFTKSFFEEGKPIGAICHGPWLLIETGALRGRKLTSYPSIKTDLENAGAEWVDEEVVVDEGLVTSRKPADIPAFSRKLVEEYSEGVHEEQKAVSTPS